jgi:hypothetical protein
MSITSLFLDIKLTDGDEVVSLTRRPRLTAPRRFLVLISVTGCQSQVHSAVGRISQIEKCNDLMGNRTRNQLHYRMPQLPGRG